MYTKYVNYSSKQRFFTDSKKMDYPRRMYEKLCSATRMHCVKDPVFKDHEKGTFNILGFTPPSWAELDEQDRRHIAVMRLTLGLEYYLILNPNYIIYQLHWSKKMLGVTLSATMEVSPEVYTQGHTGLVPCQIVHCGIAEYGVTSYRHQVTFINKNTGDDMIRVNLWHMQMDPITRKPSQLDSELLEKNAIQGTKIPELTISSHPPDNCYIANRVVEQHHLDINGHLSVAWYFYFAVDSIEEAFSQGYLQKDDYLHHPQHFRAKEYRVLFRSESMLGDKLQIKVWYNHDEHEIHIQLNKENKNGAHVIFVLYAVNSNASL